MKAAILAALGIAAICAALSMAVDSRPKAKVQAAGDHLVYRSGSYVMRFTDEPCPFEELDLLLSSDYIPPAKAYRTLTKDGRWAMPGCYAKDMGGDLATLDTAGNQGTIPQEWLSREP